MTYKLTKDELLAMDPCDRDEQLKLFGRRKSMTARQALDAGASVPDLLWVAGRMGLKRQCVQFVLACAQRTAHLNTDPRVQAALDAASKWLADPSEENRLAAADAARAAAARAADAAWAARDQEIAAQRAIFLEIFG